MFADPKKNLEQFDIAPGMTVADFGAGAGFYTLLAARMAGDSGRVYAIDIKQDLLLTIKREATRAHLYSIDYIWADLEKPGGTKLASSSVDRGIICNVLFMMSDKESFASEVGRVIRQNGKVLVSDWADSFGGLGPEKKSLIPKDQCRKMFESKGFQFEKEIEAGKHHYGFVFKKL